jgi:TolA-binding protein
LNQQLSVRIQQLASVQQQPGEKELKSGRVSSGVPEDNKKLEWTMRQLSSAQKEGEAMRQKIEEMKREELRMKRELMIARQELKSARVRDPQKKDGSGGGGKAA